MKRVSFCVHSLPNAESAQAQSPLEQIANTCRQGDPKGSACRRRALLKKWCQYQLLQHHRYQREQYNSVHETLQSLLEAEPVVRTFDVHTHRPQDHSWQGGVARAKEHHHKRRAPRLVFVPGSGASQHAIERFLHGDRVHPATRARLARVVEKLEREVSRAHSN